mmetsp:Transcript_59124/g.103970  ORF Transcript_59124/g.103970 Transcript_59124/m.103970 type:complete len:282 (-) Transcript_59124:721-1566(-)
MVVVIVVLIVVTLVVVVVHSGLAIGILRIAGSGNAANGRRRQALQVQTLSQFNSVIGVLVTIPAVHALPLLRIGIEPLTLRTIRVTTLLLLLIVVIRRVRSLFGRRIIKTVIIFLALVVDLASPISLLTLVLIVTLTTLLIVSTFASITVSLLRAFESQTGGHGSRCHRSKLSGNRHQHATLLVLLLLGLALVVTHHREMQVLCDVNPTRIPGGCLLAYHLWGDQAHKVTKQTFVVAAKHNTRHVRGLFVRDPQCFGLATHAVKLLLPAGFERNMQHFRQH